MNLSNYVISNEKRDYSEIRDELKNEIGKELYVGTVFFL
jgi:hypothetical protein